MFFAFLYVSLYNCDCMIIDPSYKKKTLDMRLYYICGYGFIFIDTQLGSEFTVSSLNSGGL